MPAFYQQQINASTRLGVWKIEESEEFFKYNVPLHREVTHPHKRLQHLAGRFLLQHLFPDFPYPLIQIADTRKPFLTDEAYHFSISHCGDYAAAIVSKEQRVGVDIEEIKPLVGKLVPKFLSEKERSLFNVDTDLSLATTCWSIKEAVFKWYGLGSVDFRADMQIQSISDDGTSIVYFRKEKREVKVHHHYFGQLSLCFIVD